jgi:pilus assembly protein Flp/PilA
LLGFFIETLTPLKMQSQSHGAMAKPRGKSIEASDVCVTAIEYGLIASLIVLGIIAGVTLTGTNLAAIFNYVAPKLAAP